MEQAVYGRMRELEQSHWWFCGRRRIIAGLLADLDLEPPPSAQVLEVGCGPGGNLEMLRRFGAVRALEPDREAREHAAARSGMEVAQGALPDDVVFAPGSFDLVCAFDVIEPVDDDAASVKTLAGLIRPRGFLIATVPAYGWMWSLHDEAHHHKRRYGRRGFEALFQAAGMTVIKASHFNTLLFPFVLLMRIAKRLLGITGEDDRMPPAWLNRALGKVFAAERGCVRGAGLPFGLSIVVIARKGR